MAEEGEDKRESVSDEPRGDRPSTVPLLKRVLMLDFTGWQRGKTSRTEVVLLTTDDGSVDGDGR